MSGVRIEVSGLTYGYGGEPGAPPALDRLDLAAEAGRVTAVVGPSGAGKSTLLRVVAGLARPDAGDVAFDGRSVLRLPPEKRRLGVVFQSYALFPHLTAADNVAFGLVVAGSRRRAARRRVATVLERLEIAHLAERLPHQLSGGERQRVALARALAIEPRALLLDEPLAALDARLRLALRAELAERLRAAGVTVLYVTHDQEEAMALGDRVAVLRAGRLEQAGPAEELYRRPATPFVASFFGEANLLPVTWDGRRFSGPLGTWEPGAAAAGAADGSGRGSLLVRPEGLVPAAAGGGQITGRVLTATFLGGRRRLRVAAEAAGEPFELKVDLPATAGARAGDLLPLAIDFAAAVLLPAAPGEDPSRPEPRKEQ